MAAPPPPNSQLNTGAPRGGGGGGAGGDGGNNERDDQEGDIDDDGATDFLAVEEGLQLADNARLMEEQGNYVRGEGVDEQYLPSLYKSGVQGELASTNRELKHVERLARENTRILHAKLRLSAKRKRRVRQRLFAFFIIFLVLLETVLVATAMVKPVPQFSLSGNLFYVQSRQADQYSKRSMTYNNASHTNRTILHGNSPMEEEMDARAPVVDDLQASEQLRRRFVTRQQKKPKQVSADLFVAFWFGAMGACLQRASGAIICAGGLSANFETLFTQSRLPANILKLLPESTGTAPVGYFVGCILNAIFIIYLSLVSNTPKFMWTPLKPTASWEKRYQFIVGTMTFFAIGGTGSFTICTVQLKNKFSVAVQALPGLDTDLFVKYDSGFDTLFAGCVLGGLAILACIWLTWWVREREVEDMLVEKHDMAQVYYAGDAKPNWDAPGEIDAQSTVGTRLGSDSPRSG